MAPSKFQIYVDQSMRQGPQSESAPPPEPTPAPVSAPISVPISATIPGQVIRHWPRFITIPNQHFVFDIQEIYPVGGGEFSFEELALNRWLKKRNKLTNMRRSEELEREAEELRSQLLQAQQQIQSLNQQLQQSHQQLHQQVLQNQQCLSQNQQLQQQNQQLLQQNQQLHQQILQSQQGLASFVDTARMDAPRQSPTRTITSPLYNRLSVIPQSLQPAQVDHENEEINDQTSVDGVLFGQDWRKDKFTLPIDQSQFIREHCATSTPSNKTAGSKKSKERRMSRPSMGGSPTMKLSPITETSRECNSKSSSSSSAPTPRQPANQLKPIPMETDGAQGGQQEFDEPLIPDRPLNPNEPTTYRQLLRALTEPLERRPSYVRFRESMPLLENGVCLEVGGDRYIVDKEISEELAIFTGQVLDSSEDSNSDLPGKLICFRVDRPANDWLYYICGELHKRIVRQKTKPDIELSVMNADPALIYKDGSILVDEYFRCVSLDDYVIACSHCNKPFPKSVAAYIALELIQLVRVLHSCGIVHMNVDSKNIIIMNCPTREDIANADEQTSVVKLIGFDRAIDTQLLPADFKFSTQLDHWKFNQLLDSKLWLHEVDWISVLNCIHRMFFLEDMEPVRNGESQRWTVNKQFKGFPTDIWGSLFDELLNINDIQATSAYLGRIIDELCSWVKANTNFVLREAMTPDIVLENFCKSTNRSVRL